MGEKEKTIVSTIKILPCKCRNFMQYRMVERSKNGNLKRCTLGCQMCGRNASGKKPDDTIINWNKDNGE